MLVTPYLRLAMAAVLAFSLLMNQLAPEPELVLAEGDRIDATLRKESAADPDRLIPVIIEVVPEKGEPPRRLSERRAEMAVSLVGSLGPNGKRIGALPIIGGAAGAVNSKGLEALSKNPQVAYVHRDSRVEALVEPATASADSLESGQLAAPYPISIRANKLWQDGITGKGIGVAVLDSGISAHNDLSSPANRLVASVNFAGDLGGMADAGGHGTHVAGIIAGNSTGGDMAGRQASLSSSAESGDGDYVGVAPGANLIDVRVLDSQGSGSLSSVLAGIQWVLNNKDRYNIRVMNLSFGAPITASYRDDPLSAAIEIAWKRGIVVVAAAGNRGPSSGGVETPGIDPFAITVGSVDDQGTTQTQDDQLSSFSSWGFPASSTPKPDVVAPGRKIVSLNVPGSYLERQFPDRIVSSRTGQTYLRLSGTSMSTAVVSGTVALMLQRRPGLKPDQVKAILSSTTQPYGQTTSSPLPDQVADGTGLVNSQSAATSSSTGSANRGLRPSDPFARALYPVLYGQPLVWRDPNYAGLDWSNLAWDNLAWDNLAWDNLAWDNLAWDNLAWDNLAWDNLAWDNLAWDNLAWDGAGGRSQSGGGSSPD